MAGNKLVKYVGGTVRDVLSILGVPSNLIMTIYKDVLGKRVDEALEILMSELRGGNFEDVDQHEVVSIIARYQRDAMEGVARNNLLLLARLIKGMAAKKNLKAPSFLKFANVLSTLTEDEIKVLSVMSKKATGKINRLTGEMQNPLLQANPGEQELRETVENYKIVQQALLRTGLIQMRIMADGMVSYNDLKGLSKEAPHGIESEVIYNLTPLMLEILKYTDRFDFST